MEGILPGAISKVCAKILHLEAALLEVNIDPVLECVCLDLDPLLLSSSDVHALGCMTLR